MNLKPTYPLPDDLEKFSEELLQSKIPNELLANCQYDSTYYGLLKRNISDRILKELSQNGESKGKDPISGINYIECNTPIYKHLNVIKLLIEKHLDLCIKRSMQPTTWSDDLPLENNPCCNLTEKTLEEFKEKFNPNDLTYFIFFKSFYYHSLTDFDNFSNNSEQIKSILKQGGLLKKEQQSFFYEKIWEDVQNKNNKVHYVERLIQFEKEFIKPPYTKCTTEEFKTDISELCENCPITNKINKGIEDQIIFQADLKKEILPPKKFLEYIYSEMQDASEVMDRVYSIELQNKDNIKDQHRTNRIELFIWNKERIKALKKFILTEESILSKTKIISFDKLFHNNWHSKIINFLKNKRFIDEGIDGKMEWIDESENTFIAFFWTLFKLELPNGKSLFIEPKPSISQYQNIVFITFQIKQWNSEKFKKYKRHNYEIQAEISNIKEELNLKLINQIN